MSRAGWYIAGPTGEPIFVEWSEPQNPNSGIVVRDDHPLPVTPTSRWRRFMLWLRRTFR